MDRTQPEARRKHLPLPSRAPNARLQCSAALRPDCSFEDLDYLVQKLTNLRRESWGRNEYERAFWHECDIAEVWIVLATGVQMERGRDSDWRERLRKAFTAVDEAVAELRGVLSQHAALGALDSPLWTELTAAYDRLGAVLRPASPGKHRPSAEWRNQTITMLRKAGVSLADAQELADTAGLKATARSGSVSRRRAALHKQRARVKGGKLPSKSAE